MILMALYQRRMVVSPYVGMARKQDGSSKGCILKLANFCFLYYFLLRRVYSIAYSAIIKNTTNIKHKQYCM